MAKWFEYFSIQPGSVIFDFGACVGEATLFFSRKTGKKGLVIALEPDITNFRVLHNSIVKYQLPNVFAFLMGIGKETGRTHLHIGGWNAHSTVLTDARFFGKRVVPIISWNDLVEALALKRVDLAKINVEGAEIQCLEGMTKILPQRMMIDDHYRFGTDSGRLEQLLNEKGYRIIERRSGQPPEVTNNLVYVERQ